jgi:hypothetical protein
MIGSHNKGLFYYVIANAFLKAFVVILYMSQSFYGLYDGSHQLYVIPHPLPSPLSPNPTNAKYSSYSSNAVRIPPQTHTGVSPVYYTTTPTPNYYPNTNTNTNTWKRASQNPNDPDAAYGVELWAQWSGWILLGSIVPSVIAFMVSPISPYLVLYPSCGLLFSE